MQLKNIYILLISLLFCTACVNEDIPVVEQPSATAELLPLNLGISGVVQVVTRGTESSLQDTLQGGAEVGVFVMRKSEYDAMNSGLEYKGDSLMGVALTGYQYNNVRCVIEEDGKTLLPDRDLYYYKTDTIVVFAYAPYDAEMTKEKLLSPHEVSVSENQNDDDSVMKEDFLLGTIDIGGKIYTKPAPGSVVNVTFRHQYSRVIFVMDWRTVTNSLEGVDSLDIYIENAPVNATCKWSEGKLQYNAISTSSILMASYTPNDITADSIVSTGIVVPDTSDYSDKLKFKVKIYKSGNTIEKRMSVKDSNPVCFKPGTSYTFKSKYEDVVVGVSLDSDSVADKSSPVL